MKKQLTRIAPLKAGIVLGTVYALLSLLLVPIFLLAGLFAGAHGNSAAPFIFGTGFAVLMPLIYGAMGFICGVLSAAIYNLVAKWNGGLEFEVRDLPPTA